jgi:hypothetical protein
MLVENVGLKNAVQIGTECGDFSNGLNCNHIASHTGREIFLTLFSTNISSLTGQRKPATTISHRNKIINSCYAEPKSSLALVSLFNPNLTAFGYF